jgi:hypothetical protein
MNKNLLFILMLFSTLLANAQQNEKEEKYRHRITVMIANSHIPNMDGI